VERLIGSIRRECVDHVIVVNWRSLRRQIAGYIEYYHGPGTYLSLGKDATNGRAVELPDRRAIVAVPKAGGLNHRYQRRAT
jgi:putative transposase